MYPVWWLAGEDEEEGDGEDRGSDEEDSDGEDGEDGAEDGEDGAEDGAEDDDDGPGMQMTRFKMSNMVIEVTFL